MIGSAEVVSEISSIYCRSSSGRCSGLKDLHGVVASNSCLALSLSSLSEGVLIAGGRFYFWDVGDIGSPGCSGFNLPCSRPSLMVLMDAERSFVPESLTACSSAQ